MSLRKFRLVPYYNITRDYHGIHIPEQWQAWETAHFFRIWTITTQPEVGARLISYGCNNGDPTALNCNQTCANATLIYSSPENLWNCMTLATMAMLTVPGNDTIDRENEKRMDDIFHFGTMEDVDKLGIFWKIRRCAWASCADSTYGHCTPSLGPFKCEQVTPWNIEEFGRVMSRPYCEAANAGIDLDIAGQGVSTHINMELCSNLASRLSPLISYSLFLYSFSVSASS